MSIRLCQLLFSALIIWACPSNSDQTESDNQLLSDLTFDEDFLDFNDDEFDEKLSSWQDNFVIRVSHQVFGQINNHQVEPIPDLKIPKTASVENHRTGINVRYQNAIAPGWLVQGSWQGRIYWKEDYEYEANNNHVEHEYRVNELFVQKSTQGQSFKLGRQTESQHMSSEEFLTSKASETFSLLDRAFVLASRLYIVHIFAL